MPDPKEYKDIEEEVKKELEKIEKEATAIKVAQGCVKSVTKDPVKHPEHYTFGTYEVLDVILDWKLDYLRGNIVKYIARAGKKNSELEDLQKARFYLQKAIDELTFKKGE